MVWYYTMTLATHAITGAAVASFIPRHPILGFVLGFASHFLADAIPHRDYAIRSGFVDPLSPQHGFRLDRAFVLDAATIGGDALIGIIISLLFFATPLNWIAVLLGAIGGILPDPLQFAYAHWPHEPLVSLQKFHMWIHTEHKLKHHLALGIFSQLLFVVCAVLVVYAYRAHQ